MEPFQSCISAGVVFCLLGVFWILQNSFNTARQFYDNRGIVWTPPRLVRTFNKLPVEGVVIILFTLCAFCTEQVYPNWKWKMFNEDSELVNQSEWLHCTIYVAFLIYGICKALATKSIQGVWYYVPLYRCFAFAIEALLLIFQLVDSEDDRTYLDYRLHLLHVLTVVPVVLTGMMEGWWDDPLLVRLRCFSTFLQGTWLFQMAFTLYQPETAPKQPVASETSDFVVVQYTFDVNNNNYSTPGVTRDGDNQGMANFYSMVFAWHCIVSVIVITFCHAMMRAVAVCIYRRVLHQKVTKGEDIGMLSPIANEV
ncbi:transmembrane protein 45B-like [Amphiura filiformis]|uniref:transmembrane protein 45B-like n=1 Tax=Amphiura filiformis TaxID=82378 RepID=UPI003B225245